MKIFEVDLIEAVREVTKLNFRPNTIANQILCSLPDISVNVEQLASKSYINFDVVIRQKLLVYFWLENRAGSLTKSKINECLGFKQHEAYSIIDTYQYT